MHKESSGDGQRVSLESLSEYLSVNVSEEISQGWGKNHSMLARKKIKRKKEITTIKDFGGYLGP